MSRGWAHVTTPPIAWMFRRCFPQRLTLLLLRSSLHVWKKSLSHRSIQNLPSVHIRVICFGLWFHSNCTFQTSYVRSATAQTHKTESDIIRKSQSSGGYLCLSTSAASQNFPFFHLSSSTSHFSPRQHTLLDSVKQILKAAVVSGGCETGEDVRINTFKDDSLAQVFFSKPWNRVGLCLCFESVSPFPKCPTMSLWVLSLLWAELQTHARIWRNNWMILCPCPRGNWPFYTLVRVCVFIREL